MKSASWTPSGDGTPGAGGQIRRHRLGRDAEPGAQVGRAFLQALGVPGDQDEVGPFGGEPAAEGRAESRGGARDHGRRHVCQGTGGIHRG